MVFVLEYQSFPSSNFFHGTWWKLVIILIIIMKFSFETLRCIFPAFKIEHDNFNIKILVVQVTESGQAWPT